MAEGDRDDKTVLYLVGGTAHKMLPGTLLTQYIRNMHQQCRFGTTYEVHFFTEYILYMCQQPSIVLPTLVAS